MLVIYMCFMLCVYCVGNVAASIPEIEIFSTALKNTSIAETSTENDPNQNESPHIIFTDLPELTIYFNPNDNSTIMSILPQPTYSAFNGTLRLPFIGGPCDCFGVTCGCCVAIRVPFINFRRHVCANITYVPQEFGLNLAFMSDDEALINETISAKNPPAICVPLPIPVMWAPTVSVCVRFHDINTYSTNMHICINFEFRIDSREVLILKFNCVDLGTQGVHLTKPGNQLGVVEPEPPEQVDVDVYDPVYETLPETELSDTSTQTTTPAMNISVSTSDQVTSPQMDISIALSNQTTSPEINFSTSISNQTTSPDVDTSVSMSNQTTSPEVGISVSNQATSPEMDLGVSMYNQTTFPAVDINISTSNQAVSSEMDINESASNQITSPEIDVSVSTSIQTTSPKTVIIVSMSNQIMSPEMVISISKSLVLNVSEINSNT